MPDVGIVSCGIYVPRYRMSRKVISDAMGWLNLVGLPGEKAVANYDEDSLTMAVAAAMECTQGIDRAAIEGVYFATTTSPYRERECAAIIAAAMGLRSNIRTADFGNSLKAGTTALLSALDTLKAGEAAKILICASDCRQGKPGSSQEMVFGDGAAALLVGSDGITAGLEGSYSVSYDFPDYWRAEYDKFVRAVEERFIREEGYKRFIPEAISGSLKKCNLKPQDLARGAYPCLNLKEHEAIGKKLGFQAGQIQKPLLTTIGEPGVASSFILLANMLEEARPGDHLLIASYGNGAEALLFKVTQKVETMGHRKKMNEYLTRRRDLLQYQKYLAIRGTLLVETGSPGEVAPTRLPLTWRERKAILGLYGSKCKRCGTPQYPPQTICVNPNCGAVAEMEDYPFSDKKGTLFSYTRDFTASSLDTPLLYGMIDFNGGGRFLFDLADCEPDYLNIGISVTMSFRRKYLDEMRGIHGYFWKAVPATE